jgi:hypothetical protein
LKLDLRSVHTDIHTLVLLSLYGLVVLCVDDNRGNGTSCKMSRTRSDRPASPLHNLDTVRCNPLGVHLELGYDDLLGVLGGLGALDTRYESGVVTIVRVEDLGRVATE